uniref:Uncharacterized protein n=1 Tax=Oryza glumipatula TaxID=40148 RepID=A0A0D9YHJ2_9ORYZ
MDSYRVHVYDSMDKEESTFDKIFEVTDKAWARFRALDKGSWKEKLGRRFNIPCAKYDQGNNLCGYNSRFSNRDNESGTKDEITGTKIRSLVLVGVTNRD